MHSTILNGIIMHHYESYRIIAFHNLGQDFKRISKTEFGN